MGDGKIIIKNTVWLTISNFFPRIIQTILILYTTRQIGDIGIGKYYTISSLVAIVILITDFAANSLVTREVAKDRNSASSYFWNVSLFKIALALSTYAILIALTYILGYPKDIISGAYIFGAYMVLSVFTGLIQSFWQAFEEMHFISILNSLVGVCNFIITFILIQNGGGFVSLIWGLLGSSIVGLLFCLIFFPRRMVIPKTPIRKDILGTIIKLSLPFALMGVFSTIYFRIDTVFLSKFQTEAVVGQYGTAHKIIEFLQMVPYALLGAVYPAFSRLYSADFSKFSSLYKITFKIISILSYPVLIGILLLSADILRIFGSEFTGATIALNLLAIALFFMFPNSLFMSVCMAIDKIKVATIVALGDVVLGVLLNLFFIPSWGANLSLNGAALTAVICEVFNFIVLAIYLRRAIIPLPLLKQNGKLLMAGIIMGIAVFMVRRYGLVAAMAVGIITYPLALLILKAVTYQEINIIRSIITRK